MFSNDVTAGSQFTLYASYNGINMNGLNEYFKRVYAAHKELGYSKMNLPPEPYHVNDCFWSEEDNDLFIYDGKSWYSSEEAASIVYEIKELKDNV